MCAIVGSSNSVASGMRLPSTRSMSAINRAASNECPPRSKKLSLMPIGRDAEMLFPQCDELVMQRIVEPDAAD